MTQHKKMPGYFVFMSVAYTVHFMTDTPPKPTTPDPRDATDVKQGVSDETRAEEAKRLKDRYKIAKRANPSLTQDWLAEKCGWAGQSVVSQYFNGKIALNLAALIKFAGYLKFDPAEVSPRLAEELPPGTSHIAPRFPVDIPIPNLLVATKEENDLGKYFQPIEMWDDSTPLDDDEIEVPFFAEIQISAGGGSEVMLETNGRKLRFGRRTLQRKNIIPELVGCAPVKGNSMEPVLPNGSTVGVDTGDVEVQDGKMYALAHHGQLRVKILYRLPGGGLRVKSYNEAEHPEERYDMRYVQENIRVIGKVFWYSVLL